MLGTTHNKSGQQPSKAAPRADDGGTIADRLAATSLPNSVRQAQTAGESTTQRTERVDLRHRSRLSSDKQEQKMVHSSRFDFDGFASSDRTVEDDEIELLHRHYILAITTVNERPARADFNIEMHRLPEARRQLIFRIRRQMAEGNYDTPDRWEAALDRLFDVVTADAGAT